jgi:hypothetical protein
VLGIRDFSHKALRVELVTTCGKRARTAPR